MVALSNKEEAEIIKGVMRKLKRRYACLGIDEDCENCLARELQKVRQSQGYRSCENPKPYLWKVLLRIGDRFCQKIFKQVNAVPTESIPGSLDEFPSPESHKSQQQIAMDVNAFLATLSSKNKALVQRIIEGMCDREIGMEMGISQQAVQKLRCKIFSSARIYFRDYKNELN